MTRQNVFALSFSGRFCRNQVMMSQFRLQLLVLAKAKAMLLMSVAAALRLIGNRPGRLSRTKTTTYKLQLRLTFLHLTLSLFLPSNSTVT